MALFIRADIILPKNTEAYIEGLATFSQNKKAVSSQYSIDNPVAKVDRVTAQIHIFRTLKRDGLDRLNAVTRTAKNGNDWFEYRSTFTVDAYDLKVLLAICALGKAPFANYLYSEAGVPNWTGLASEIQVRELLKFIDRRNDPENRKRLFASLDRLCAISISAKIYNPTRDEPLTDKFILHKNISGNLTKIFDRSGDKWIKIGLFQTVAYEAWIDTEHPQYAPVSMQEVHALSKSDIAILLLVFFRSDLGAGAGAVYRYDDIVRLVRGEDRNLERYFPTQGKRLSRNHHHAGADRQSISNIRMALQLIDERTDMKIYKHRDTSKFVVIRPKLNASVG
jgi:hypothetical protein